MKCDMTVETEVALSDKKKKTDLCCSGCYKKKNQIWITYGPKSRISILRSSLQCTVTAPVVCGLALLKNDGCS